MNLLISTLPPIRRKKEYLVNVESNCMVFKNDKLITPKSKKYYSSSHIKQTSRKKKKKVDDINFHLKSIQFIFPKSVMARPAFGTMSGSSPNTVPPGYWFPGQDYWVFVRNDPNWNRSLPHALDFITPRRTLAFGGRIGDFWSLLEEERFIGDPHGPSSFRSTVPPSHQLVLFDPRSQNSFPDTPMYNNVPRYNQSPPQEESTLSKEEQNKALNKLRKQLYNPHLRGIIKRLGANGNDATRISRDQHEDGQRCAVCLEDFKSNEFVMLTPCDHMFHEECIVPWMKSNGKCPVCRFVMAERNEPSFNHSNGTVHGGIGRDMISVMRAFNRVSL